MKIWSTGAYRDPETLLVPGTDGVYQEAEAARIKVDGAWVDVWPSEKYLYKSGDECTDITGGWTSDGYTFCNGVGTERIVQASYEKRSECMYLYCNGEGKTGILGMNTPINVTPYKKIYVDVTSYGGSTGQGMTFSMSPTKKVDFSFPGRPILPLLKDGIRYMYECDISQLSGNMYVALCCENGTQRKGYIYNIWLEP